MPGPRSTVQGKEVEITPKMIEAGVSAIFASGVEPWISTADWASDLADQVYRAMANARLPKRNRSQSRKKGGAFGNQPESELGIRNQDAGAD